MLKLKEYSIVQLINKEYRIVIKDSKGILHLGKSDGLSLEPVEEEKITKVYDMGGNPYNYFFDKEFSKIETFAKVVWERGEIKL